MSCHGCAQPFGFFKKEFGCPRCGFSFCKHCLRFKIEDQEKHKSISVCQVCFATESGNKIPENADDRTRRQWVETAKVIQAVHRLESLTNPVQSPITVYVDSKSPQTNKLRNLERGLSTEDQQILERLKELRSSSPGADQSSRRKSETTAEEEVAARLAKLRGVDPRPTYSDYTSSVLFPKKPETEEELFNRLANQVDLDKKYEKQLTGDITDRLARLRGTASEPNTSNVRTVPDLNMELDEIMDEGSIDEISEEQQVQNIINQFVAQVALDEKLGKNEVEKDEDDQSASTSPQKSVHFDSDDDDFDVDMLCRICEEKRATLACKECDNDIFCQGCFKEFHTELGEFHKPSAIPHPPR